MDVLRALEVSFLLVFFPTITAALSGEIIKSGLFENTAGDLELPPSEYMCCLTISQFFGRFVTQLMPVITFALFCLTLIGSLVILYQEHGHGKKELMFGFVEYYSVSATLGISILGILCLTAYGVQKLRFWYDFRKERCTVSPELRQ